MMRKASKVSIIFFILIILSFGLLTGCGEKYPEEKLNAADVINIVFVHGVPTFPIGSSPQPTGNWGAVYQGEGEWRIQGTIAVKKLLTQSELMARGLLKRAIIEGPIFETVYYQTTWSYVNSKLKLINYE